MRAMVLQDEDVSDVQSSWIDGFPLFMKAVGQLLWPIGNHTTFMEFLMERFQPSAIQGYVRLPQNWFAKQLMLTRQLFTFYLSLDLQV